MKVHLSQQEHTRKEQLGVLKYGMVARAKELKKLGKTGSVSLHHHDDDTVEIIPLLPSGYSTAKEVFGIRE